MRRLQIALDVEGVLADSHIATARKSDLLSEDQIPPHQYDFGSDELLEDYMHVSQNVWHNHNHTIPPMEDGLWKATRKLSRCHEVDILTARTGVDRQVKEWLDGYNVRYNDFIVTDRPRSDKTDYGDHDVHIEDSPNVAQDALDAGRYVYLIDRPYNDEADAGRVKRVSGVTAAVEELTDPTIAEEVRAL